MAQPSSFVLTRQDKYLKYGPRDLSSLIDRRVCLGFAQDSVGAVGVGSSGIAYLGINVELPRLPRHHSIHAMQFLVTNLALNSETNLTHVAFSTDDTNFVTPCDHCLYFLQEIQEPPKILIKNPSKTEYVTLHSLLREYKTQLFPDLAHLLEVRDHKLTTLHGGSEEDHHHPVDGGMKRTALAAANRSFSPYRNSPSGVALKDREQKVYWGWYIESVASAISLGPVQAALVHFVTEGGTKFEDIVEAVLVEKKDADVSQEVTAKMILDKIAPDCAFTVFHCLQPLQP
ncbi:hypothetical protein N665_0593s0019 [Sinapis alba]|nr:hypothetical protein N665_0593s0019 [Sinapis alba]